MGRHLGVGPVDPGLVEAGLGDAGFQVVADDLARHAAKIGEGADMGADPLLQTLAPAGLGIGEVGGAEGGDEDLGGVNLTALGIDDLDCGAGVIDEQLLARDMVLPHRR